jgi:uncharacterized protein YndB with AHSA1/START domain
MTKHIKHQIFYPHPPETVWEYLTKPELMAQWLMKNNFQPIVGTEFQFRTSPIPSLNFDGVFYCTVLEIVHFRKLSYSWSTGPGDGKITLESIVVWTLQPTDKGTELFLDHSGFDKEENVNFYEGLNHGWVEKLQNIAKLLNVATHGRINA